MRQGPLGERVLDRLRRQVQKTAISIRCGIVTILEKQSIRQLLVSGELGSAADMPDKAREQSLHTSWIVREAPMGL